MSFDLTYMDYVGAEAAGGGLIQSSLSGNSVELAGAFGQGVSSGIIGFLVFQIKNSLPIDGTTNISLNSFSANENSLHSTLQNGTVRRVIQTSYRPVAIAGLDFSLQEGSTGHLDGTASFDLDNDPMTYRWKAPDGIVLSDSTSPTPEFTAPYVSKNTVYSMRLIVNDGTDDSDPSYVNVTVLQVNVRPEASAGADQNLAEGSSVSLDGSASFDPDGDAISYNWTSLDGIVLFNTASVNPSFILPQVTVNTSYRFTLVVNDGALASNKDTVTITAIQVNKKPVAFAGGDFSLNEKEEGQLDGSLSFDGDNDPLTYLWTAPSQVTLSSSTIKNPMFTAPSVVRDSVLSFTLVVNDGSRDSDPDVVRVTIVNLDSLSMETYIDSVFMTALDSFAIDTSNAIVTLYLPYGQDIRSLSPGFTLSRAASMNPASGTAHDFSMPVYYRVTAEDGVTSRLWKAVVYRPEKTVQRSLNSGWNWVSLNIQPQDMDIATLFGGLSLIDLDYLKSTEYSSTWYNTTGWFGNLSTFPQNRMLKFRKSSAEILVVQGLEINPSITPIPLAKGWNDLAYLLGTDEPVQDAIIAASIPPGDALIKGPAGSAIYYAGSGWVGDLDTLNVLHGYKLNVQATGNLFYNPSASSKKSMPAGNIIPVNQNIPPKGNTHKQLLGEYGLVPENFEFSATLIAEVRDEKGESSIGPGDLIMAYHGEEIRGVSETFYVPSMDRYLFILTYFSEEEGQAISFRVRFMPEKIEYNPDLKLNFRPDEITGEAWQPHTILVKDLALSRGDQNSSSFAMYPNPVSDRLTVELFLTH